MRSQGVRSIPAGPRAATSQHPLGLTQREQQVLALLAGRRTNAEIGQELFISPKTVDHHVSAVLAKLNVNSREQAAAFAGRVDLDEQAARPRLPEHSS
jgi:DNA-binding NarL/FixJ family response regulator